MSGRCRGDDGFATVWTAWAVCGLLTLYALLMWLGAAVLARHRAAGAADLAALAGATSATDGTAEACAQARLVTGRMGAQLTSCAVDGHDVLVQVTARPPGALSGFGPAIGRARAGPVR